MKWDGLGRWALILVFGLLTPPAVAQEAAEEAEGQKKEEKWDVSNPPGEWSDAIEPLANEKHVTAAIFDPAAPEAAWSCSRSAWSWLHSVSR